jgi:flagellar basal body-associated protein FliL
MKVLLPSENRQQNKELTQALPKIKHRIIEKMDDKKAKMIRNGNLASFKKELVSIVNQELKTPVKDLYFQQVNLY